MDVSFICRSTCTAGTSVLCMRSSVQKSCQRSTVARSHVSTTKHGDCHSWRTRTSLLVSYITQCLSPNPRYLHLNNLHGAESFWKVASHCQVTNFHFFRAKQKMFITKLTKTRSSSLVHNVGQINFFVAKIPFSALRIMKLVTLRNIWGRR